MKRLQRIAVPIVVFTLLVGMIAVRGISPAAARPQASATSFHFVYSADSRDGYSVLSALSRQMVSRSPVLGVFGGDLCGSFDTTCINNTWKPAMDGNSSDGILAKTFVLRGNHDSGTLSTWQGLWDFQAMAARVGATNFKVLTSDATYSFDYGNSHFAILDNPGGDINTLTSSQISWLDSDLTSAEARGIAHEFLFTHGPVYGVTSQHGSATPTSAMKAVLNSHPISAGFNGHEHVTQYTHVTPSVESGINSFQEFTLGRAGAPAYTVVKYSDWHADQNAFADIAINGSQFTVTIYSESGSALFSQTFTDGSPSATSTPGATSIPQPTATPGTGPTPTPGTGPTPTPISGGTSSTGTYTSNATYDGYILETSETSTLGGTINATATSFRLGDDAANRQYRAVLSFNTAGLPDNATITSVTLKIKQSGSAGANPYGTMGNIMGDIISGSFSGSSALQGADFQATAGKNSAMSIPNTPTTGLYSKAMSSTYFPFVNKTGVTQIRLRFATDDNNNAVADYLSFYTSETTTTANRPVLVIKYTVP